MRTIKMMSAACAAVCALAALSAPGATAHEWLIANQKLTKSVATKMTVPYTFEDQTIGAKFECTLEELGTAGVAGAGQITSVKAVSCKSAKLCETTPTIEALKLPWTTNLVTYEGGVGNEITTAGPEWKWKCRILLENRTEYCGAGQTMNLFNAVGGVEEGYWKGKVGEGAVKTSCLNAPAGFYTDGHGRLTESAEGSPLQAT